MGAAETSDPCLVISTALINACAGIGRPSLPSTWAILVAVERDHSTPF
jgi:hypothetical protein